MEATQGDSSLQAVAREREPLLGAYVAWPGFRFRLKLAWDLTFSSDPRPLHAPAYLGRLQVHPSVLAVFDHQDDSTRTGTAVLPDAYMAAKVLLHFGH
jgi:hypothetical protein